MAQLRLGEAIVRSDLSSLVLSCDAMILASLVWCGVSVVWPRVVCPVCGAPPCLDYRVSCVV